MNDGMIGLGKSYRTFCIARKDLAPGISRARYILINALCLMAFTAQVLMVGVLFNLLGNSG